MRTIEVLKLNKSLLCILQNVGIRIDDVRYIELYNDYKALLNNGEKVSYIVAMLAKKYNISERTVYGLLKRLQKECPLI